jgi:hypothetical protein
MAAVDDGKADMMGGGELDGGLDVCGTPGRQHPVWVGLARILFDLLNAGDLGGPHLICRPVLVTRNDLAGRPGCWGCLSCLSRSAGGEQDKAKARNERDPHVELVVGCWEGVGREKQSNSRSVMAGG